jgi:SAM-dependent methyltransferase
MTFSALNAWNIHPDAETLAYHLRHGERLESTKAFADFIAPLVQPNDRIVDMGCGAGGTTAVLQSLFRQESLFRQATFSGIDLSLPLIRIARKSFPEIFFARGDINHPRKSMQAEGVISLQTFSWMPGIERPLKAIAQIIYPRWIACSSLFYDGDISAKIVVNEPQRPRKSYYNVYSIPRTQEFMRKQGYRMTALKPFVLNKTLPAPDNPDLMKTWTYHDLQISGPLLLPWYFIAFERIK